MWLVDDVCRAHKSKRLVSDRDNSTCSYTYLLKMQGRSCGPAWKHASGEWWRDPLSWLASPGRASHSERFVAEGSLRFVGDHRPPSTNYDECDYEYDYDYTYDCDGDEDIDGDADDKCSIRTSKLKIRILHLSSASSSMSSSPSQS